MTDTQLKVNTTVHNYCVYNCNYFTGTNQIHLHKQADCDKYLLRT